MPFKPSGQSAYAKRFWIISRPKPIWAIPNKIEYKKNKFGPRWLWTKMTQNDFGGSLAFMLLYWSEVSR